MSSSSGSGVLDPLAVVSDDEIIPEEEILTSDSSSSDEDDFQPFALPEFEDDDIVPIADGFHDGDLPLAQIPAPIPLAMVPVDLPLDDMADDDIDLFIGGPPEDAQDGGIPADDDVAIHLDEIPIVDALVLPLAEAPIVEAHSDPSGPDSSESVSSAPSRAQGVQHHSSDTDSDTAMSAAPVPPLYFEPDDDPIFPHDFDPDYEVEFIIEEQPVEAPALFDDQHFDMPVDVDMAPADPEPVIAPEPMLDPFLEPAPVDQEPMVAPEPVAAHDPLPIHDPILADIPVIIPPVPEMPVLGAPIVAPIAPASVPAHDDLAPFATHIDPRYAHTRNGWIDDDDDLPPFVVPVTPPMAPTSFPATAPFAVPSFHPHTSDIHRTDLPITFLQDIPPPRPGEGSSRQPVDHTVGPSATPFSTPPIVPPSDPYHPDHIRYSSEDILSSFMIRQEELARRVQELERAQRCPCQCQTPSAAPHPPRSLSPDSVARFWTPEQQIAYLLRSQHAMEADWLHMRRLLFSLFPPPPPPSA